MKMSKFLKTVFTFGLYALFASYKKKNPKNDYTLVVDTLLQEKLGPSVTRGQMLAALTEEMNSRGLSSVERDLAIALLTKKLDEAGIV